MFGSLMLDVAIGMVLVYLLLSFVAAAVREGVETLLKERSRFLQRGVTELLHDPDLTAALFSHPQVSALYRGDYAAAVRNKELPSYIPSRQFRARVARHRRARSRSEFGIRGWAWGCAAVASVDSPECEPHRERGGAARGAVGDRPVRRRFREGAGVDRIAGSTARWTAFPDGTSIGRSAFSS